MTTLNVVGSGPKFHSTSLAKRWRDRLSGLAVGGEVDVLLDDGRIVRTRIRGLRKDGDGRLDGSRCCVWVEGITGSYAAGRVRPADGWWRTRGCKRGEA